MLTGKIQWQKKLSIPLRKPDFTRKSDNLHRFIIEASSRKNDKIASIIDANHGKIHREIKLIPSLAVELPYASLEELARLRFVKRIWHDAPVYIRLDIAVPSFGGTRAHELGFTGKGIVIAVIDTGIYPHRDLISPENRIIAWHDLLNRKETPYDDNGHGTHISGIIAGNGISSNGKYKGVAPDALLVGVKALNEKGGGSVSNAIAGIEWCLDNLSKLNIKAINMSFGSKAQESHQKDPLCRATTIVWNKGLIICAAAGNKGPDARTIDTPGINPKIITVGNADDHHTLTNKDDLLNRSSSRGPTIDNITKPNILAPGTDITSTWISGGYRSLSGTSMSTPMVTGAAALICQKWPALNPDQVKSLIVENAYDLGLGPNLQGAGLLDLTKIFGDTSANCLKTSSISGFLDSHLLEKFLHLVKLDTISLQNKRDRLS